jgi:hypothetical protein
MKLIPIVGMVASVIVSILASNNAMAASTVYQGSICHNYYGKDATQIEYYYSYGVSNSSSSADKKIICPITKRVNDGNSLSVRVNLEAPANTITCTLYSYNSNGKKLGFQTVRNRVSGIQSIALQTPFTTTRSHSSLFCNLPPNSTGSIYSIEVLS